MSVESESPKPINILNIAVQQVLTVYSMVCYKIRNKTKGICVYERAYIQLCIILVFYRSKSLVCEHILHMVLLTFAYPYAYEWVVGVCIFLNVGERMPVGIGVAWRRVTAPNPPQLTFSNSDAFWTIYFNYLVFVFKESRLSFSFVYHLLNCMPQENLYSDVIHSQTEIAQVNFIRRHVQTDNKYKQNGKFNCRQSSTLYI